MSRTDLKEAGGKVHTGSLVGGYWDRPNTRWREATMSSLAHGGDSAMVRTRHCHDTLQDRVRESIQFAHGLDVGYERRKGWKVLA